MFNNYINSSNNTSNYNNIINSNNNFLNDHNLSVFNVKKNHYNKSNEKIVNNINQNYKMNTEKSRLKSMNFKLKLTYDNLISLRDFIRYLYNQNVTIEEGKSNIIPIIGDIKSLIYKYYSNPIICFQNNDTERTGKMDFNKFKNIVFDMYNKNEIKIPNFTQIKNAFDAIDLRKDGIIDLNEWCKAFSSFKLWYRIYKNGLCR